MSKSTTLRKTLATALTLAVSSFQATIVPVMGRTMPRVTGELFVVGPVILNGTAAVSGITVFSDSRLQTRPNGSATVNLGKLGRVELGPGTEITLRFSAGVVGGNLLSGWAVFSAPAGVGISVATATGVAVSDTKQPAVLTVDVTCGNTRVAASRGEVRVTSGHGVEPVKGGQEVTVGAQNPGPGYRCNPLKRPGVSKKALSPAPLAALLLLGVGGTAGGVVASGSTEPVSSKFP